MANPEFVPESKDILQVRVKTTGVIEYNFVNEEDGKEFIMVVFLKTFHFVAKILKSKLL